MNENNENNENNERENIEELAPVVVVEESEPNGEPKKNKAISTVYDYVETFCYALAVMMVLFLFVFRYVSVDGESMRETLQDNDKLIISNLFYTPQTGDIVVINPESHTAGDKPIIKRVIATGGQTVRIDFANWEVYVDGVKLDEPYIQAMRAERAKIYGEGEPMATGNAVKYRQEFIVEPGTVFVMGDNRNNSRDSRFSDYGEIGENRILGRVLFRVYPNFGGVD